MTRKHINMGKSRKSKRKSPPPVLSLETPVFCRHPAMHMQCKVSFVVCTWETAPPVSPSRPPRLFIFIKSERRLQMHAGSGGWMQPALPALRNRNHGHRGAVGLLGCLANRAPVLPEHANRFHKGMFSCRSPLPNGCRSPGRPNVMRNPVAPLRPPRLGPPDIPSAVFIAPAPPLMPSSRSPTSSWAALSSPAHSVRAASSQSSRPGRAGS